MLISLLSVRLYQGSTLRCLILIYIILIDCQYCRQMSKKLNPERYGPKKEVNQQVVAHFTSDNPSSKKRLRKLAEVNHQEQLVQPENTHKLSSSSEEEEPAAQYHQFGIRNGDEADEPSNRHTLLDKFIENKQKKGTKKKVKQTTKITKVQLTLEEMARIKKEKKNKQKFKDDFIADDDEELSIQNPEPSPSLQKYQEVNGSLDDEQKLIEYAKKLSLQEQSSRDRALESKVQDTFHLKKQDKKEVKQDKKQDKHDKKEKKEEKPEKKEKKGKSKEKGQSAEHHGPLAGYVIAFTGQFEQYQKDEVIEVCMQLGAVCPKSLTKKCNLLIQGSYVMDHFKRKLLTPVNETTKSRQALERKIQIISCQQLQGFFMSKAGSSLQDLLDKNKVMPNQVSSYLKKEELPEAKHSYLKKEEVPITKQESVPMEVEEKMPSLGFNSQLWTEKYKPTRLADISGHNSQVRTLKEWLATWEDVHIKGLSPHLQEIKGETHKPAVLLSGDPGIGKTTTARLVASQLNLAVSEFNASDVRNKSGVNLMQIGSYNLDIAKNLQKSVIIMDEIDGMSSGDRGGIAAIIQLIKNTKVPIICICNDRSSDKMRSLSNYCLSIAFHKPMKGVLVKKLKEILHQAGGSGEDRALELLVQNFNNDMRQILTYLELIFKTVSPHITLSTLSNRSKHAKDSSVMINHFAAARTLLNRHQFNGLKIAQRTQLFFVDSDLVPLLVHENLLGNRKNPLNLKQVRALTQGYKGLVLGDLLDNNIRKRQEWGLMPSYGFMSCVYPTEKISESCGFPQFPAWLGKNSSERKNRRLVREVKNMLFCQSFCSCNSAIRLEYVSLLTHQLAGLLKDDHIETAIQMMDYYNLTPAVINEHLATLANAPDKTNPLTSLASNVKSKLTRLFNKFHEETKLKQQKGKRGGAGGEKHIKIDPVLEEAEYEEEEAEEVVEEEQGKPDNKKGKKKKK